MLPNLNPNDLVIFYFVAKERSLSAAADKVYLTQPAVTYHIQALEEFTGVKLLEFKKRQIVLTPHGEALFKYAEEVYRQLTNAEGFIKSIRESSLRAGIASMYISTIGPVIKRMHGEHPEVKLTVKSGDANEMVQGVLDAQLDLAIVPQYEYDKSKLNSIVVSPPQQIVCFASFNQFIQKEPLSWKDLSNYPLVSGPENTIIRKLISEKLKEQGLEMQRLVTEVNSTEWCKTLVEDGKGISFTIIGDIENQIAQKRLKIVQMEENLYLTAEVIMRTGTFMNPAINEYIAMVKQAFGYKETENPGSDT
ncbi:MAG: LysR family transcriptional regulator [Dehalococcoidales bacterium]|nr:LysR family transcriptional regulator [Dehalococcoidales bacterium]